MQRVLALVEGHTEERFVKTILCPHLLSHDVIIIPTLLVTKRTKGGGSFKGGVSSYAKFRRDICRLLGGAGTAFVTTMLDYYQLPEDFPGMDSRPNGLPLDRVTYVENAISDSLKKPRNFLPYLSLHEFEALLFSSNEVLPQALTLPNKRTDFCAIRKNFNTPEDINEVPGKSPSKRIKELFPGYRKALHGPYVASEIGLGQMRSECPHFANWISTLENLNRHS